MRIVNVMLGRGLGGIEQALVDYCEALKMTGHDVLAIVHPSSGILPELRKLGIAIETLSNHGAWDLLAAFRLWKMIKNFAPDACIGHGNRALSLLKLAGAPRIVGVMHNYKIKCAGVKFVFYPTQDLLSYVHAKFGAGLRAYHVPNLVRVPPKFHHRLSNASPVIGAMGRFVAKKGFALFIESLALLKERDISFRAMLAGRGEEEESLKALARDKGLESMLEFPGWVENKQAFFDAIDLFCLPSHHEPFGIALLEAMAQGLPVIATASEGPSEILEEGEPGVLVPMGDPTSLADAFALLLTDNRRAEMLGKNAYDAVKSRYDLPVVARKLDLALQGLCRL